MRDKSHMFWASRKEIPSNSDILLTMIEILQAIVTSDQLPSKAVKKLESKLCKLAFAYDKKDFSQYRGCKTYKDKEHYLIRDSDGISILHYAAAFGFAELFNLNLFSQDFKGNFTSIKSFDYPDKRDFTPALYAALNGQMAVLEKLLILLRASGERCFSGRQTTATFREALYYRYVLVLNHVNAVKQQEIFKQMGSYDKLISEIDRLQQKYKVSIYRGFPFNEIANFEKFVKIFRTTKQTFFDVHEVSFFQRSLQTDHPPPEVLDAISVAAYNISLAAFDGSISLRK